MKPMRTEKGMTYKLYVKKQSVLFRNKQIYAKSIADLVDVGCIMSRPTREELQPYSEYISSFGEPNLVIDVYKIGVDVGIW